MSPLQAIESFQAEVQRLYRHRFIKDVGKARCRYSWRIAPKNVVRNVVRPSETLVSGYAAQIRGFMTNDDEWSLSRMPNAYRNVGASRFQERKLKEYRKKINQWLKRSCGFARHDTTYSNHDILDIYIYGRVLHLTRKEEFASIMNDDISGDIYMHKVCSCLITYSGCLGAVHNLNQMVISRVDGSLPSRLP